MNIHVQFGFNHICSHSKCESDKNNIIKEAMINKSDIIIKSKKREVQLYKERVKIIDDKIKVKHDQDERKKQQREAKGLTNN
jgi:hypothetical protein